MKNRTKISIWLLMLFGGSTVGLLSDYYLFPKVFFNLSWHLISLLIGLILLFLVFRISRNTGKTLAKYGREGKLKKMETNVLATQGVYAFMRHPMHLGLLFFPLSFAFLSGSLIFIFVIAPIEMLFIVLMLLLVEEPEIIKKFDTAYFEYMKKTPAFCFTIKCLQALLFLKD